jgi:hypothetical protein
MSSSGRIAFSQHWKRIEHNAQGQRGVSDLGVRTKPQGVAEDAVSLWFLNPSLLIINELELSNEMANLFVPNFLIMAQCGVCGASGRDPPVLGRKP